MHQVLASPAARAPLDGLLATKLHVPRPRPELVRRPRLSAQLPHVLAHPLSLVCAPAGFGKTTLLATWIQEDAERVAWVSLDPEDNDPARFWTYVVAALQSADDRVGATALGVLRSPQPPAIPAVLVGLINELTALDDHVVLVLDDYHVIESQPIHEALGFLIDHLPPRVHLVLASRADPPLPLARWRANGALGELRAADLRFTPDEAAAFLNEMMGLGLGPSDVATLEARTEGWIAGLQLAALSIQGRADVPGFIAGFGGSHRFILDYLVEQVLERLPAEAQEFLLETSILDRMSAPLCDALTGRAEGQTTLERLERDNLFVVALDDERRWYRYHHLFSDVLRHRLERSSPGRPAELHRRASAWYERAGYAREAVGHALAAADLELAARLIERAGMMLARRGEMATLGSWLERLPPELVQSRARLAVTRAWMYFFAGQYDAMEAALGDVERHLATGEPASFLLSYERAADPSRPAEPARLSGGEVSGEIAIIRSIVAKDRGGDNDIAIALARQALRELPEESQVRGLAAWNLGESLLHNGDVEVASAALEEALAVNQAHGHLYGAFLTITDLAHIDVIRGRLRRAEQTYRRALELGADRGEPLPAKGLAYVGLAVLHYEWDDLATAWDYAREGVKLAEQLGIDWFVLRGKIVLARVRQARGDHAGALRELPDAAQMMARDSLPRRLAERAATSRVYLFLAQGERSEVDRWARASGLSHEDVPTYRDEFEHLTFSRALLSGGRPTEALQLLGRLLGLAESQGRQGRAIEVLALQALGHHARGDLTAALAAIERALALAEPEGYVRLFVDEGAPMAALVAEAERRSAHPAYVRRLRASFGALSDGRRAPEAAGPSAPGPRPVVDLVEPLTEREREVLGLIAAGASNRAIADRLVVSLGTVKKHGNNIYGKLGVQSRTQAIARARELGVL